MRSFFLLTALAVLVMASVVPAVSQQPARSESTGLVVSVAGDVTASRTGSELAVVEGFVLRGGDRLTAVAGARCTGFAPDGEAFALSGPAELEFLSFEGGAIESASSWVKRQLADWIGKSRRRPLTTRGVRDWDTSLDVPAQVVPAPDGAVRAGRAQLLWTTVPGIERYVVTVAPATGDEIQRTVRGSGTVVPDLVPGEDYVWKVQPDCEGWRGVGSWRGFRVLTPDEERGLDEALESLESLEAGVLLLASGLHEEAVYRFDAAVASPENGASARLWRARALADVGLHRQAYDDLIEAWDIE